MFLLSLMCASSAFSQHSDIGLQLTSDYTQRIMLEYRLPFTDKWKFNLGASYGSDAYWNRYDYIVSASDSLVVERSFSGSDDYAGFRFGFERQFKESMFSISGEFQAQYRNSFRSYYDQETTKDSLTGEWRSIPTFYGFNPGGSIPNVTYHYVIPSLTISGEINIPLGERFLVNAWLGAQVSSPIFIGESNRVDPDDVFNAPIGVHYLNFNMPAGIGLRYVFGHGKNKKEPLITD